MIVTLNRSANRFTSLTDNELRAIRRVRKVDLARNSLASVWPTQRTVYSVHAQLRNRRRTAHIQFLRLDRNPILQLPDNAFAHFDSLVELHVSRTRLAHIDNDAFVGMGRLKML